MAKPARRETVADFLTRPRSIRRTGPVIAVTLGLLGVLVADTTLELNTPQNETFGGIPLLCVVIGLWLLPGWAGLLVATAALAQPVVLLEVGEWRSLTAEFQFIAVAIVTVVETLTVTVLVRVGAEKERLLEGLTRFTADAAHELRSPLSTIRNTADVTLQRPRAPGQYVESLEQIRDQATRLTVLTDGLLLLARGDTKSLYVRREPLSMDDVMEELFDRWRDPAEHAHIALDVSRHSGVEFEGDAVLLGRLFDNLVDNALTHATSSITVSTSGSSQRCTVVVEDDGPGFPAERRPGNIDRHWRGDGASSSSGGVGLGLSIAAAIAAEHGGVLNLEHPGRGLRAVVQLSVTSN
jgi:two-component system OmpR family sensor kinase